VHPYTGEDGKIYLPAACHTMFNEDKINFSKGDKKCKGT
jgi:hypothetical protein